MAKKTYETFHINGNGNIVKTKVSKLVFDFDIKNGNVFGSLQEARENLKENAAFYGLTEQGAMHAEAHTEKEWTKIYFS